MSTGHEQVTGEGVTQPGVVTQQVEHVRRIDFTSRFIKGNPDSALPSRRDDRMAPCWSVTCSCGWDGGWAGAIKDAWRRWRRHSDDVRYAENVRVTGEFEDAKWTML